MKHFLDELENAVLNLDGETEGAKAVTNDAAAALESIFEVCKPEWMPLVSMLNGAEQDAKSGTEPEPVARFDTLKDGWKPLKDGGLTYYETIDAVRHLMSAIVGAVIRDGDRELFQEWKTRAIQNLRMTYKKPCNAM